MTRRRASFQDLKSRKPLLIAGILLLLLVPAALLAARHPQQAQAEWFDANWGFRTRFDLANSTGSTQTDFQVQISTDTATLYTNGKILSNCNDVRFTDNHGKLLPHWLEPGTCNNAATKFWVKVPSIPTTGTSIYMYYGNSNASAPPYKTSDVFIREIPNLVGAWNMDESSWTNNCSAGSIIDSSGNNNNGQSCGPTAFPVVAAGKYGNSATISGQSGQTYINVPNTTSMQLNTFSVSFWVKLDPNTPSYGSLMGQASTSGLNPGWDINRQNTTDAIGVRVDSSAGSNQNAKANITSVFDNTWHFITYTFDGTQGAVTSYKDGTFVKTDKINVGTGLSNNGAFKLGLFPYSGSSMMGNLDNVRLYGKTLDQNEVADSFGTAGSNQGYVTTNYPGKELVRKYSTGISFTSSNAEETGGGPIAYWKMDEGGGTTILDSSTNRYSGTLASGVTWRDTGDCISGKCLYFDGSTNAYASLGASSRYGATATQGTYTLESWVKVDTASRYNIVFQHLGGADYISFGNGSSKVQSMVYDKVNLVNSWPGSNGVLQPNVWNHFVYVFSNRQYIKIYINGKLDNTINNSNLGFYSSYGTTAYLGIGNDASSYFRGFMDEVKVYAYERTPAQIQADMISAQNSSAQNKAISIGSNTTVSPLNNGLIAYWKMDEATWSGTASEVVDSSGNSNHGTAQGTTGGKAYPSSGKFGNGGYFDGTDDDVTIPYSTKFDFDRTDSFTISFWTNAASNANNPAFLGHGGGTGYYLFQVNGDIRVYLRNTYGTNMIAVNASSVLNGTWKHIVVTYSGNSDASGVKMYVNGNSQALSVLTNNLTATLKNGNGFSFTAPGAASYNFKGSLDELRIYNRALAPSEVQALYSYAPGPVAYYPLEEGTTGTANDFSGNNNNSSAESGTSVTNGMYGKARLLAGTSTGITIPDADGKNDFDMNQDFTVSAWIKSPATQPNTTSTGNSIMEKWNSSGGYPYVIRINNQTAGANAGKIVAARYDGTNNPSVWTLGTYNDNKWHYISFVKNGTSLSLYVDGTKANASSTDTTTVSTLTATPLYIGSRASGYPWQGGIDEIKIYNYARSNTQVIEDMNGGHPAGGSPVGSQAVYYKFNEGYGSTLNNAVSTNYTGTLFNNVTWENDGKFGKSLRFDGTTSQITVGGSNNYFKYQGGEMTLSLWVKPDATDDGGDLISKPWNGSGQYNYRLTTTGGATPSFNMQLAGATSWSLPSNKTVTAGTWHHIVFTVQSNGSANFYVDGVQTNTGTDTVSNWTPASGDGNMKLVIGCIYPYESNQCAGATTLDYKGSMDEIKIYNSALTPQQVYMDYNAGAALNFGTGFASDSAAMSDGAGNPPVAYWNMEEGSGSSAYDKSGNNNVGTWQGTLGNQWTQGKLGKSGKFNGTNNYINIPYNFSQTTNITVSMWFKTSATNTVLFGQAATQPPTGPGSYVPILLINTAGRLRGELYPIAAITTTTTYNDGKWHYVSLVGNGTSSTLYVDGAYVGSNTGTINFNWWQYSTIGAGYCDTTRCTANAWNYFNGQLDEVKLYNYARTAAQIAYDYNRGAPVAWWKFDECSDSTFYDATGNGNNGTWAGGTSLGSCTTPSTAWGNGATGKFNSSLAFNSANSDYLSVSQTSGLPIYNNTVHSVSMWLKFGNLTQTAIWFICDGNSVSTNQVYCLGSGASDAKKLRLYVRTDTGSVLLDQDTTNAVINDLNWHHVVLIDNNGTVTTYVDGVAQPFAASTYSRGTLTLNRTAIGALLRNTAQYFFNGQIDDVRVYNYALSQTQVNTLFNGGAAVKYGPITGTP